MFIVQSGTDSSSVRPTVPPKFGSGIGSTVRSGLNFPIASASDCFSAPVPCLSPLDDREEHGPLEGLLDTEPLLVVEDRDDAGRPRRQVLADLVVDLLLDPMVDEPADHPACDRADGDRGEHRRREQADGEPDAATPAGALPATVVASLPDGDASVLAMRDEDDALDRDLLRLHQGTRDSKSLVASSMSW